MNRLTNITFYCCLALLLAANVGCRKKTSEQGNDEVVNNDTSISLEEQASKMGLDELKATVEKYKKAMQADKDKMQTLNKQFKSMELPGKMEEAEKIMVELERLNNSFSKNKMRFNLYYQQLRAKGGDITFPQP